MITSNLCMVSGCLSESEVWTNDVSRVNVIRRTSLHQKLVRPASDHHNSQLATHSLLPHPNYFLTFSNRREATTYSQFHKVDPKKQTKRAELKGEKEAPRSEDHYARPYLACVFRFMHALCRRCDAFACRGGHVPYFFVVAVYFERAVG